MSTDRDPAAVAEAEPVPEPADRAADDATEPAPDDEGTNGEAANGGDGTEPGGTDADGADSGDTGSAGEKSGDDAEAAAALSEAAAELAAQRELRERIERRKAEKEGPIPAGTKLSGQAADLLAAVRAMESGAPVDPSLLARAAPERAPEAPVGPPRPEASPGAPGDVSAPSSAGAQDHAPVHSAAASSGARATPPEAMAAVRAVLGEGGAPEALAGQLCDALGERAADALRENPWLLLSAPGVRPEQADGFARALLGAACGPGDERRAAALVGRLLERAALRGHTALEASSVREALAGHAVPDPDAAVRHAVAEGAVLVFQDGAQDGDDGTESAPGEEDSPEAATDHAPASVLLGLDRYALAEESLADGLARLIKTGQEVSGAAGESWAEAAAGAPSPSAAELIRAVAGHALVLHTGGEAARAEPVALAMAARALGLRALVAVHSENGRARLGADVGAVTVAGLLAGAQGPGRDAEGAFALDLLVVLDAPQLDVETAAMLVESLPDAARLVLSGDPGVLWSAGAGRVFGDLLAAGVCPRVASRTPDPGPVGELVSGIGIGELNQVEAPGKEVVIVPVRDAGEAVHRTVQLVAESVPRAFGVEPGQTQVITVGHGGSAGTRALNAALKQRLNPGPGAFGGFDPGDSVAYVPAPGRTLRGTVLSADAEGLRLDCAGEAVVVPRDRVESAVRHGWALTAHQAAGMRWPAAVVVLPGDAAPGLSRPWVYTAFGRGERHLSVVHGVDQALARAVADIPSEDRTTRLRPLLEALLAPAAQPG
ncbi:helix-hairpin-helix domain-containing protein [Streptomyces sp. NBC_01429]|uniref:helix-hairpin-helix domain-containing protein n=1 Tax=Streptomyces sp. NBC_01429 TaxID=2903862 RepID=UPI002E2C90C3|nr:helix-hairpin-helix domain-containing protein [Streptomyces sp. NBC_01429]